METISTANKPRTIVYGEGPKDAKIMIIGEAPGEKEEKLRRPFVGPSGQLLEDLLYRAGIMRRACYITNVVKEKPYKNNINLFITFKQKTVVETEAFKSYVQLLKDEIEEVKPNVIVCVGAIPLWAVCGKIGSTKWRGSIIESTLVPGMKVIPIIHPAAAMRQYIFQHFISFDLGRVKAEAERPEIELKERNYIIRPDYFDSMQYLDQCSKRERVAFDIEVSGMQVSCISFSHDENTAISIPFMERGREYFTYEQEAEVWLKIAQILEDPGIECVGQNVTFDSTFLFRRYGIKSTNLHDTMIAIAVIYPDFPKGLDFITSVYTDMSYYKDEGKDFMKGAHGDEEQFWLYNARDSIVLMEAFPKMLKELEKQGNLGTYDAQRKLIPPLLYMTEHGILADKKGLEAESARVEQRLAEIREEVNKEAGRELNLNSPKQLVEYFYGRKSGGNLGIPALKKGGKATTDENALMRLARGTVNREPVRAADLMLEHRKLAKLKGTYLDMKIDDDGRIRSSMNPVGNKFGRLSSSKTIFGTGANMQNQPPIMKKFMKPDEGHIAYDIDLSQAENRLVAYIAPEGRMIEAFEEKIDVHSRTASYIFNIPEEEIAEMDKEGVMCKEIGGGKYTHRFWGKKANHAFNYGQSANAFAKQMLIPDYEGKIIHNKYHLAYPGVRKYHNWVEQELRKTRSLTNLFNRRCMFLDRWDHFLFMSAFSFIPQSTVADMINRWGLHELYFGQSKYAPVKILNQVHDSIVIQIEKEEGIKEHARCLVDICQSLSRPMSFRGREFNIPSEVTILKENMKDGKEISRVNEMTVEELEKEISNYV